jgi:hypothetical protein
MRRLYIVLAAIALIWWSRRDTPVQKYTGIILYKAPQDDSHRWAVYWLDLESGATGRVGFDVFNTDHPYYVRDRTVAWLEGVGRKRNDTDGTLRVARNGKGIATQFIPNLHIRGVSADEQRAVVADRPVYGSDVELVVGIRTVTGFARGDRLGVGMTNTTIFGWLPDGSIAADRFFDGGRRELLRLRPGKKPRVMHDIPQSDYLLSHDTRTVAWLPLPDDEHDDEHDVHIAPFADQRKPRVVSLGRGDLSHCVWAPDDRTLGCEIMRMPANEPHYTDAYAIDVATGRVRQLGTKLAPGMVFSPDGSAVMLFDETMTIVRADGTGTPLRLKAFGAPFAWIR